MRMKNNVFVIKGAIAVLLLCGFIFFSCAGVDGGNGIDLTAAGKGDVISDYTREFGTFEGLDAEIERRILQDYFDTYIVWLLSSVNKYEFYISKYYGTHNRYVVITITDGFPPVFIGIPSRPYHIDGVVFPWLYPSGVTPIVWNNGIFNSIEELYNSGLLTRDDLLNIANYHKDID